ncbi:triosephosphate isomerase [Tistlia consotensis]|uniref:Triosephosphate isomerase n=1 Tax=Tistlia consotensis USBA 355 TaxID=560819 RepID=A0A1Y6CKV8_9PROT|nr:triose-phosphate isomerase [Tistlia consotensis]SMF69657.1 triosephosphate isomerase [Tistlia consotensis USBA 355]SNS05551.1 triosephosphate isomerase [Tistlia consotensis]
MGRPLIAGNWKMNGRVADGRLLAEEIAQRMHRARETDEPQLPECDLLVCPPFTLLETVHRALAGSGVALGAQDCHPAASGAHTGDISAAMLADLGCSHVIVGHSERRHDHGEGDALVRAKAEAALAEGLVPVVCVGETAAERDAGRALAVVTGQLAGSLPESFEPERLVLAYEPVWAIGTGKTATPADAAEVHQAIRGALAARFGAGAAAAVRILYGGSVKPENAAELLRAPEVDGALVGGASLKSDDFWRIAQAAG